MSNDDDEIDAFTDLGARLSGPEGAEVAAEIAARIDAILAVLRSEKAVGVPYGTLDRVNALEGSLVAARQVVLMMQPNGGGMSAP